MGQHFWSVVGVVAVGAGLLGWLIWLALGAWLTVKTSPREDMYLCPKHGPLRKKNVISFGGLDSCPLCFHERMLSVENGRMPQ